MEVNKTISRSEVETILRKHFESSENAKLADFKIDLADSSVGISYKTALVQPTILDKSKETISGIGASLKSHFKW
jgi:hypothetical protein